MKYKILLGGENSVIIKDFFQYTEKYFQCLTTSDLWNDIIGHFEFFKPDVYVIFLDSAYNDALGRRIEKLREDKFYNSAPIVIVGRNENCREIETICPELADLLIKRPISSDNLALSIIDYLEKEEADENEGAAEVVKEPQEKKHILVVDDDRTVLKMLKSILGESYEVTAMLNGTLVEKFLATRDVDVIILDYEMPIMTGADVYRKLKDNPKTRHIPVCFLTGVSERSKVEEIMSLKPRGYLLKPINTEMLLATISNLTRS